MRLLRSVLRYVGLTLIALVTTGPFLWLLSTSLKGTEDIFRFPPTLLPSRLNLENFVGVWQSVPLGRYLMNSLLVAILTAAANVLLASLAAYPLARLQFRGKSFVFLAILATMMVPEQVILIPLYTTMLKLGLDNTFTGLVLPFSVNGFGIFLLRQAYRGIPKELDESAFIDGGSVVRIWWEILVPLTKPASASLAVFSFIASWSSFLWPLILLKDQTKYTLPVGLSYLLGTFSANYRYLAAGSVLAVLPVIIVFVFTQRYFIGGILSGAMKSSDKK